MPKTFKTRSLGSGFIIDPSGIAVTNNHVVQDASKVTVILQDGSRHPAKIIGRDAKTGTVRVTVAGFSAPSSGTAGVTAGSVSSVAGTAEGMPATVRELTKTNRFTPACFTSPIIFLTMSVFFSASDADTFLSSPI